MAAAMATPPLFLIPAKEWPVGWDAHNFVIFLGCLNRQPTAGSISMLPEFLTSKEVAKLLRMTTGRLEHARIEGKGPPYYRLGRAIRYDRADLDRWIAAGFNTRTATHAHAT